MEWDSASTSSAIPIKGDSVEEAVAFTAATLLENEVLTQRTVVVTDKAGWQFVAKNPNILFAIAARPECAEAPPDRAGLLVIIPYATGDMKRQFKGTAGRIDDDDIVLDRISHHEFDQSLKELGIEENDARRLSGLCGRSWSVFRRQHATNPAIRSPAWLDHPNASALSLLCLVGSWSSAKDADRDALSQIAGRSYESIERDLLSLEQLDDSPIIHIGTVWKAKSPLELMALFAGRISEPELDRFCEQVGRILSKPDPTVDLPSEERTMAGFRGVENPISGFLIEALCDTLVKLAVRGPDFESLAAKHIEGRVAKLVRTLLDDADRTRWLSLASQLPSLAEAAPAVFLAAVEKSLDKPDAPIRALLAETDNPGILGSRCWHAGLLWALETLAWAPQRLMRVSLILARLTETEIKGNWGNTPANTLLDLYRSWMPQTAANIDQRIEALSRLVEAHPKVGARLLDGLTQIGHDVASPTARPDWRDDDSGAGYGASGLERHAMLVAAADMQLRVARGDPLQIAALVQKYDGFDAGRRATIIELGQEICATEDGDRETLRSAVRHKLHWHLNYDTSPDVEANVAPLQQLYEDLAPRDPVIRDGWLFKDGWVDLPVRTRDEDFSKRDEEAFDLRGKSVAEIYATEGWTGLLRLAEATSGGWLIGRTVLPAGIAPDEAIAWLARETGLLEEVDQIYGIATGILTGLVASRGFEAVHDLLAEADAAGRETSWKVRSLAMLPEQREVWDIIETLGEAATAHYWKICRAKFLGRENAADRQFALERLLEARRPLTAFRSCHICFEGINPETVMLMLESMLRGDEEVTTLPEYWCFQKAIDYIEESNVIHRTRLIPLEFALVRALGFQGEHHAKTLFKEIMSNPAAFVELLSLVFHPKNGERKPDIDANRSNAQNAWSVLHACKRQPGTQDDDTVTTQSMLEFVHQARELATDADRIEVCDSQLGQIMAHAPAGDDGVFPFEPARDVLEQIGTTEILSGFHVGCFNKRGVHSRGLFDGGDQERGLADHYRNNANALAISHPRLSDALESLARSYDRDGIVQDLDARLNRERR